MICLILKYDVSYCGLMDTERMSEVSHEAVLGLTLEKGIIVVIELYKLWGNDLWFFFLNPHTSYPGAVASIIKLIYL